MSIDHACWKTESLKAGDGEFDGSLAYYDPILKQPRLLNLNSLDSRETISGSASPDGTIYASMDIAEDTLHIITTSKESTYPIPENSFFYDGFVSNSQLVLGVSRAIRQSYIKGVGATDQYYLLNLETGELTHRSVFLPFFEDDLRNHNLYIEYSPDLKYAIYSADDGEGNFSILYDIQNETIVWRGRVFWGFPDGQPPVWKPDSSAVIAIFNDDGASHSENFYEISVDGRVSKLTDLRQVLASYGSLTMIWSPAGRYLLFMTETPETPKLSSASGSVYILDTHTHHVLNPCIAIRYGEWPIWSPDSRYLAIIPSDMTQIVIVDIENEKKFVVYKQPGIDFVDPYAKPDQSIVQLFGWLSWELP